MFDSILKFNKAVQGKLNSTSDIYDKELIDIARETFKETGLKLTEGFYCYYALPNYES